MEHKKKTGDNRKCQQVKIRIKVLFFFVFCNFFLHVYERCSAMSIKGLSSYSRKHIKTCPQARKDSSGLAEQVPPGQEEPLMENLHKIPILCYRPTQSPRMRNAWKGKLVISSCLSVSKGPKGQGRALCSMNALSSCRLLVSHSHSHSSGPPPETPQHVRCKWIGDLAFPAAKTLQIFIIPNAWGDIFSADSRQRKILQRSFKSRF